MKRGAGVVMVELQHGGERGGMFVLRLKTVDGAGVWVRVVD